ncbi:hypothetical protein BKP45_14355 [Anaerobacillus alkalidiazotrophicus]|uniref:Transposase DDE domain-containing protein n=1 Tax=Anaerobacillus alkalidiazotrophicus TaxID=472963 RepID=A0A1S2M374_9BACI|nr:hypothetical protein BKP45_14355 [Anaerobacillus alkalidiazotrophicus]
MEPVFGFLKANLRFTRMSVRSKEKVENELGFAFMAVNLRKYTAINANGTNGHENNPIEKRFRSSNTIIGTFFLYFWLVMSQPLSFAFSTKCYMVTVEISICFQSG